MRQARSNRHRLITAAAVAAMWSMSSGALAATQTPAPVARDAVTALVADARALIDAGKPDAAIAKLRGADAGDPRIAELLGVAYYHANDPAHAIAILSPQLDRLPRESLEARGARQVLG